MKAVSQAEAIAIDETFFTECGYSVDQLMELAGQSVAHVVYTYLKPGQSVLVICGPGNNGGDGLVAARHLHFFGFPVSVFLPKPGKGTLLENLVKQMKMLNIPVITQYDSPDAMLKSFSDASYILDAIFGHSFKPPVRPQFAEILDTVKKSGTPVISIDVPSGWDVEKGDVSGDGIKPLALVSMSAPKLCSTTFKGDQFLGGRFVPKHIQERFGLQTPEYPGASLFIKL